MQLPTKQRPDPEGEKFTAMVKAAEAVKLHTTLKGLGRGRGGHGGMPCPVPGCRGRVSFIVYTGNGHLMASCNQRSCLNVRE
jgi:hypothetical protein